MEGVKTTSSIFLSNAINNGLVLSFIYMTAGVYLHIPFCKSRCSYCDFATEVFRDAGVVERYVDALCREIRSSLARAAENAGPRPDVNIDTIYFGGGTPSLLEPAQLEKILDSVISVFSVAKDAEITMEMNPATVKSEKLAAYRRLGVNRASFGVQTFNDRDLKLLARGHDANDARSTFQLLRNGGFDNISFDLIAGLPEQTIDEWSRNLDEAIAMRPEHLSLYLLEIHEGTPLAEQVHSGRRTPIDDQVAAEMYEMMIDRLVDAGYGQYEISNFARPGYHSRHNTKYWLLEPVYGFGVSAHSFDGRERYANERDTANYVKLIESSRSAEVNRESVDLASDAAFLGLRLNSGIDITEFEKQHSRPFRDTTELIEKGLLEMSDGRLRLTRKGMLFSNEVFAEFL